MTESQILDEDLSQNRERRRKLLPIWIKVFLWIFLVSGVIAPLGLILGFMGIYFNMGLYGLETTDPLSVTGLVITLMFTLKGAVSFGLWTEKDWAINLAIIDAILGILACAFVMFALPYMASGFQSPWRLELLLLIPYLVKMQKIRNEWENRG